MSALMTRQLIHPTCLKCSFLPSGILHGLIVLKYNHGIGVQILVILEIVANMLASSSLHKTDAWASW